MLYLLGSLFIIGGTTGLGLSYIEREKQRIMLLEKWEYITELFLSEITYKKQPLSLASIEIGRKILGIEGEVLRNIGEQIKNGREDSFAGLWKKEWKKYLKKICLSKEEKNMILDFSIFTGFENEEIQQKMILVQQEKWKRVRVKVQEENTEKKKVILVLSFTAGMLIVLMLL